MKIKSAYSTCGKYSPNVAEADLETEGVVSSTAGVNNVI